MSDRAGAGVTNESVAIRRAARLGIILACSLTAPPLVAAVGLAAGVPLSPIVLVAVLAAIGFGTWRYGGADAPVLLGCAAAIIAAALLIAAQVFDLSYDGQVYHQVAIRALAHGWNPVWAPRAAESMESGMFVFSLPKAAWMLEAMVYQTTGSLESAKGVQFVAVVGAFLLAWCALEGLGLRRRVAIALAALAVANPVGTSLIFTFHVDSLIPSTLIMILSSAIMYWLAPTLPWAVTLVLTATFLANLRLSGLMYAALVATTIIIVVAWRARRRLRSALTIFAVAAGLVVVQGINPYVTNTIVHGNPAYPVAGRDAVPHIVDYDPGFVAQSRVVQLVRSIFSRSTDDDRHPPHWKLPFTVHAGEFSAFTTVDTRIGGWGPLFGGALLVTWAMLAVAVAARVTHARMLALISLGFFLSALAIPFGYYSRYTPQLWFACLPPLMIAGPRWRAPKVLLTGLLVCNWLIVVGVCLGSQLLNERLHREQLRALAQAAGGGVVTFTYVEEPFVNVDLHFDAYGIHYRKVDSLTCDRPARLLRTHAMLCLPGSRSPAPEPVPLTVVARARESILAALRSSRP